MYQLQFVDRVAAAPTVRLDLNSAPWKMRDGTEFGMPELRRSVVSSLLTDGDRYPAAAYGNRMLSLLLRVDAANDDDEAAQLQRLYRELDRACNVLLYRPNTSSPIFFRTFRCGPERVTWNPFTKEVQVSVPAEPFAVGLKESLPQVTVYNDPAEGTTLNATAFFESVTLVEGGFEVDLAGYSGVNATAVRSTAQAHAGVASALVTPGGTGVVARVEADQSQALPAVVGQTFTAEAWVRPTTANKPAAVQISWRDAGGAFLSSSVATAAATAGVWQFVSVTANAPVGAAYAHPAAGVGSTPAAGDTAFVDELRVSTVPNWTQLGGMIARSTAQAHEGVSSLLLTPDGVSETVEARSENVPVTAGQQYRSSAWVRCAVARTVTVGIIWRDASNGLLSSSATPVAIAAATWTLLEVSATAPVGATKAQMVGASMNGTPPASNTVHVDEARLRQAGGAGGMCFDLDGSVVKGDVETPLYLSVVVNDVQTGGGGRRQSAIGVRRRGTPAAVPMVVQAEAMTPGLDTAVQSTSAVMSGSGSNYMRTTFAGLTSLATRLATPAAVPATPSVDVRGTYRVFARVRKTVGSDVITMRLGAANDGAEMLGDVVTLPSGTDLRWVELGLLPVPLGYDPQTDGLSGAPLAVSGSQLTVWAGRSSGTGALDVDVLLLVPADDRYCEIKWSSISGPTSYVVDSGANAVYALGSAGQIRSTELLEMEGLPPMVTPGQAARLVVVQDVGTTSVGGDGKTNSTRITPYFWPKYLHVRPVAS